MAWSLSAAATELRQHVGSVEHIWRINISNSKTIGAINAVWDSIDHPVGGVASPFVDLDIDDWRSAVILGTPNGEGIPRMLTKYAAAFRWKSILSIPFIKYLHNPIEDATVMIKGLVKANETLTDMVKRQEQTLIDSAKASEVLMDMVKDKSEH
ncbi:hypothetical protein F5Y06DRAFT_296928 [Hypoxylon sp. FL0890]|nr:hypothetical protein F5Y06DRAFT_296928 [Hypoxylon sp. FL0890]